MGFFDLNIPYKESNKRNSAAEKSLRLKLAVKSMELGYTGVAYNRTITGVMSEVDRCSISLFPLSSVLKVSPFISSSVNLHRRLLNVPPSTPFRQYTRLTVVVDTPAKGSALNSGNPILKTYDIVAVRPLKQDSFDQACKNYEVDVIAIDFSENRFRLKQPLIKAAIERGVCFEITYSGLLVDAQLKRQMMSNVKLLVDWTRGKNIIFTSAAPSVTELRGPYDVANLASLLGFSNERAKSAVSRTCRSLLENAIRKKKFHKETIRIELIPSAEQTNIDGGGFDDWLKWDPISSGDGDLQLDEMAKSFATSGKESKTVKAIDFVSIVDELSSHGLHKETKLESYGGSRDLSAATKAEKPTSVCDMPVDSDLHDSHENGQTMVMEKDHSLNLDDCDISANEAVASVEMSETCPMVIDEETKIPSNSNICIPCHEAEQQNLQVEIHKSVSLENVGDEKVSANTCSALSTGGTSISCDENASTLLSEEASRLSSDVSLHEEFLQGELIRCTGDAVVTPACSSLNEEVHIPEEHLGVMEEDVSLTPLRPHDELTKKDADSVVHQPAEDMPMKVLVEFEDHNQVNHLYAQKSSSERVRTKCGSSRRSVPFPFKRLLKPSSFKKVRKLKTNDTILSLHQLIG